MENTANGTKATMDSLPYHNNRFLQTNKEILTHEPLPLPVWPLRDARVARLKDNTFSKLHASDLIHNNQNAVKKNGGKEMQKTSDEVIIITPSNDSVLGNRKLNIAAEANTKNSLNHQLHDVAWFPLCFPFFFLCCIPAMLYMKRSDKEFSDGHHKTAKRYTLISTALYASGIFLSLAILSFIVFLIVYFLQK